ncbi:glycosyltransferase [Pedobacter chinensis]|uniref:Glycosyltransferase n=2 Tax=Pedobacter chinensis TaxID=2282421 RepID=A0A369PVB3_9SPHI|nr:glycosyltransferase [Pedobacter chinensis]
MIKDEQNLKSAVLHSFPGIGKFTSETIKAYDEAGWLAQMFTTIIIHENSKWVKIIRLLAPKIIYKFKNRNFSEISSKKIKLYPYKEIIRLFAVRYLSLTTTDKIWEWAELSFDKWVASKLSKKIKIIHSYEHAAMYTFERAKKLGIFRILEQTSRHYGAVNTLIDQQFEKYPNLRSAYIKRLTGRHLLRRNARKKKEHDLADLIICNSSFTKGTLVDGNVDERKIIIVPLAFPKPAVQINYPNVIPKIHFLYAGSLSVNKGTHLLIEIWNNHFSDNADLLLTLVGKNLLPDLLTANLPSNVKLIDFVHQSELNKLYDQANVFVFPTLADGFGMVITEAMARGLPVIASRNSAGPDLIKHGHDGLLINAGDDQDLLDKINWCIANKDQLKKMSTNAHNKAKSWQWENYREKLIEKIALKLNIDA